MLALTPLTHQRGLALVETAITLPFLLFVMLATTEFTNAFIQHTTMTKAVRDGARWAAEEAIDGTLTVNLTDSLKDDIRNVVVFGDRDGTGTPIIDGLTATDNYVKVRRIGTSDNIEVSLTYRYDGIFGSVLPSFGYGSSISSVFDLSATVTMRAL